MVYPRTLWLIVSVLASPLVNGAAQPPLPGVRKTVPSSTRSAAEALAQKQGNATLAAMEASIDKQRASVAGGLAASIGKPPARARSAADPEAFFTLPPLPPGNALARDDTGVAADISATQPGL